MSKSRSRINAFMREAEAWLLRETLLATGNSITETARTLGINRPDVYRRLYRCGLMTRGQQRRAPRTAAEVSPEFRQFLRVFGGRKEEESRLRSGP